MWMLGKHLVDQCVYAKQDVSFIGSIATKIESIKGQKVRYSSAYVFQTKLTSIKVPAALMTSQTKVVYRSCPPR